MILIVDMNWKKDSLSFNEFVLPIVAVVRSVEEFRIKHFLEIEPGELNCYSKIVLSGTALKDHATLKQVDKFTWVITCGKPILGICAGMQTISLLFDEPLVRCLQIGMAEISTLKENPLFHNDFKAYVLHNYSVKEPQTFEVLAESSKCIQAIKHKQKDIFGVLFHPEMRNQEILRNFLKFGL